jgi:hypothetical protein
VEPYRTTCRSTAIKPGGRALKLNKTNKTEKPKSQKIAKPDYDVTRGSGGKPEDKRATARETTPPGKGRSQ